MPPKVVPSARRFARRRIWRAKVPRGGGSWRPSPEGARIGGSEGVLRCFGGQTRERGGLPVVVKRMRPRGLRRWRRRKIGADGAWRCFLL